MKRTVAEKTPLHRFLQWITVLCGGCTLLCAAGFFAPMCTLSLYASFPSDNSLTVSAYRLASGVGIGTWQIEKPIFYLFLILPLAAACFTLLSGVLPRGIGQAAVLVCGALQITVLVAVQQLFTAWVSAYRAYVIVSWGWYAALCFAALFTLLALVALFAWALLLSQPEKKDG